MIHVPQFCNIKDCQIEATRWIDTKQLANDFNLKEKHTFYFCEEHANNISPNDDVITYLNPETGNLIQIELAVYSCDDNCRVCIE